MRPIMGVIVSANKKPCLCLDVRRHASPGFPDVFKAVMKSSQTDHKQPFQLIIRLLKL